MCERYHPPAPARSCSRWMGPGLPAFALHGPWPWAWVCSLTLACDPMMWLSPDNPLWSPEYISRTHPSIPQPRAWRGPSLSTKIRETHPPELNADWEQSLHIANFDPKLNEIKKQTHKEALFLREESRVLCTHLWMYVCEEEKEYHCFGLRLALLRGPHGAQDRTLLLHKTSALALLSHSFLDSLGVIFGSMCSESWGFAVIFVSYILGATCPISLFS